MRRPLVDLEPRSDERSKRLKVRRQDGVSACRQPEHVFRILKVGLTGSTQRHVARSLSARHGREVRANGSWRCSHNVKCRSLHLLNKALQTKFLFKRILLIVVVLKCENAIFFLLLLQDLLLQVLLLHNLPKEDNQRHQQVGHQLRSRKAHECRPHVPGRP